MGEVQAARAVDGTAIEFETHGDRSRPTIFMGPHFYKSRLEGDAARTDAWIDGLKKNFFLVVTDYPRGVGQKSNPPGSNHSAERAARDIELIADAAGVERFGWVGYSYGGAIGVQLACRSNRVAALAVGGFPPLNAPFRLMVEILTRIAASSPPLRDVEPGALGTAAAFYASLAAWPERQEVGRLNIPRMAFMGDQDTAQGMPEPWSVPLADRLRTAEGELRALGWQINWLKGHDHRSSIQASVSLAVVNEFFGEALLT